MKNLVKLMVAFFIVVAVAMITSSAQAQTIDQKPISVNAQITSWIRENLIDLETYPEELGVIMKTPIEPGFSFPPMPMQLSEEQSVLPDGLDQDQECKIMVSCHLRPGEVPTYSPLMPPQFLDPPGVLACGILSVYRNMCLRYDWEDGDSWTKDEFQENLEDLKDDSAKCLDGEPDGFYDQYLPILCHEGYHILDPNLFEGYVCETEEEAFKEQKKCAESERACYGCPDEPPYDAGEETLVCTISDEQIEDSDFGICLNSKICELIGNTPLTPAECLSSMEECEDSLETELSDEAKCVFCLLYCREKIEDPFPDRDACGCPDDDNDDEPDSMGRRGWDT